ncbi:MAG TPA: serine hydrolase domain-containing protein [Candidatus Dormibacteraeota bacterium]|nr:serine hydrolase domain-containing protein [Candidatus Dormibacteraeota bacterium]
MTASNLSASGLRRLHDVLAGYVQRGEVPGLVAVVARRGEVQVEVLGAMEAGGTVAMRRDAIFRIASLTKQMLATVALILVEDCGIRLDDAVDPLLPELAGRRVLRQLDGPVDDTVPARRPITLRDLLTNRMGLGMILAPRGSLPIQRAIAEARLSPGPDSAPFGPDEYMRRLGTLPLVHQPGEGWMYHVSSDVLGVLLARAAGRPLPELMEERLLSPLGMADTGFHVPPAKVERLPAAYRPDPVSGALVETGAAGEAQLTRPPSFPSGGGGMVSTADDLLTFSTMLLNRGRHGGTRILSRSSVELMTTDQLTDQQRADNPMFFAGRSGWGMGLAVDLRRTELSSLPGRFGWEGGTGASLHTDPVEGLIGILLTQRSMTSPLQTAVMRDFWTCAYAAIDD